MSSKTEIPFLSANLRDVNTKKLLFEPYIVLERGDLSFGVIGVTSLLPDTSTVVFADEFIEAVIIILTCYQIKQIYYYAYQYR